jgi:class 3 adenylate cyclase
MRAETTQAGVTKWKLPVFIQVPVSALLTWWNRVINIGVHGDLPGWKVKRIRLLNGICVIPVIILAGHVVYYSDEAYRVIFYESLQGMLLLCVPVVLNHYRKYDAAAYFFVLYSTALYSFFAVSHGPVDAAEYILIPASVCSMLFFREFKIVAPLFLLNLVVFFAVKYLFTVVKPFLFMPYGENLYYSNHFFTFVSLFLVVYYFKSENTRQETQLEKRNEVIAAEKTKSDNLLLNILPKETAEELKETGRAKAKSYDNVSVFFSDIRGFTNLAEHLPPAELVSEIDYYFRNFDRIMAKHNIEKIKTIGDAYMCAGGIPEPNTTHAVDLVRAALEVQEIVQAHKEARMKEGRIHFEVRIGIHTGPVVAGIVGERKFAYDIWGDTVNVAARMESSGEVGKVNISGATYAQVKDQFRCTYRGKVSAKGKGEIDMYFVDGPL